MLKKTPLFDIHEAAGGKLVEFAGYLLPVQYKKGIIAEHTAVRTAAGLFDVSHMGEILVTGKGAAAALRRLVTNNVSTMENGQCRYAIMCCPDGGIVDDIIIYKKADDDFLLVVNAANREKDFAWMKENLTGEAEISDISDGIAQIALQGPRAKDILKKLTDINAVPEKKYRFVEDLLVGGMPALVSTTGYTGEDGYELYIENKYAVPMWEAVLEAGAEFGIEPAGLGCRDTLRFEAAMPLYGHELSKETKANEVGLDFAVKMDEDFIGRDFLSANPPKFKRAGFKIVDRGIAREHAEIFDEDGMLVGETTSGAPCPSLGNAAYVMARVRRDFDGKEVFIDVRGRKLKAEAAAMPFYKK